MIVVVGISAFIGSLLTASVFSAIFASDRIRRRRRANRPYAL